MNSGYTKVSIKDMGDPFCVSRIHHPMG